MRRGRRTLIRPRPSSPASVPPCSSAPSSESDPSWISSEGQMRACVPYCISYILSCVTKHSPRPQYKILMIGRVLGGTATSLLFSAFESCLVAEHNQLPAGDRGQTAAAKSALRRRCRACSTPAPQHERPRRHYSPKTSSISISAYNSSSSLPAKSRSSFDGSSSSSVSIGKSGERSGHGSQQFFKTKANNCPTTPVMIVMRWGNLPLPETC